MAVDIHFRQATAEDEAFRYRLFVETSGAEFVAMVGGEGLLQMQYRAREMSYAMSFPDAKETLICLSDGRVVGRQLLYLQPGTTRLVDIGLLKQYRGQGVGTMVLGKLLRECEDNGRQMELQVSQLNPAVHLYLKMGFTVVSQDAMYAQMMWQPVKQAR